MLKQIKIEGMKCFDKEQIDFSKLTLLAGKNSAGKSTVIQAILAMCQNGINSFSGDYMKLGETSELKNRIVGSKKIRIEMLCDRDKSNFVSEKIFEGKAEHHNGDSIEDVLCVRYLAADRIGVKDTYEKYVGGIDEIGINCQYAFHYLCVHEGDRIEDDRFILDKGSKMTFGGQVDYWLDRILGYRVTAEAIEGTELIRVTYSNQNLGRNLRPVNIGTGVSYIAEIIIAALACKNGDVLIIENPEIHLHPSGQAEFIQFVAFLAERGIQIIIETHSDHIYNGLRKCISKDYIKNENVKIYFFMQDKKLLSHPIEILMDENGKVSNPQEGLFDQIEKDLDDILGW